MPWEEETRREAEKLAKEEEERRLAEERARRKEEEEEEARRKAEEEAEEVRCRAPEEKYLTRRQEEEAEEARRKKEEEGVQRHAEWAGKPWLDKAIDMFRCEVAEVANAAAHLARARNVPRSSVAESAVAAAPEEQQPQVVERPGVTEN